jgi:hypothetical protein
MTLANLADVRLTLGSEHSLLCVGRGALGQEETLYDKAAPIWPGLMADMQSEAYLEWVADRNL